MDRWKGWLRRWMALDRERRLAALALVAVAALCAGSLARGTFQLWNGGEGWSHWLLHHVLEPVALLGLAGALVSLSLRENRLAWRRSARSELVTQELFDASYGAFLLVGEDGRVVRTSTRVIDVGLGSPLELLNRPLDDLPLYDDDGERRSWPRQGRFQARLARSGGSLVEVSVRPLAGHPGMRLAHLFDVTGHEESRRTIAAQDRELQIVAELAHDLNSVRSGQELLDLAVREVARHLPVSASGGIFVVDREAKVLRLGPTFGLDPAFVAAERTVPLGECLCGHVAVSGEMLYSASSTLDPLHTRHRDCPPHGHIVAPLKGDGRVLGVLFLYLPPDVEVREEYRRLMATVAGELGLALTRVQEHASLQRERQRLHRLFEGAPDAIVVARGSGEVLRVNRLGRRWFRTGENLARRLPWDPIRSLADEPSTSLRIRFDAGVDDAGVDDAGAPPAGRSGALRQPLDLDVTATRVAADEIQLILRDVSREAMLERKTLELEKMEAVGVLASGLAHNLNNVFACMLANVGLLEEAVDAALADGDAGEVRERLAGTEETVEQVSDLIDRLLELARPATTRRERIDVCRLVRQQMELARPMLDDRITLRVEVEDPCHAEGDPAILGHALMNLVLNAAAAMPEGGELSVRLRPSGDWELLLEVGDTGTGMDTATRDRIFEPFFTTKGDGTGLGLTTVRAGLASLGGRIEVESSPGAGSTFRVLLPRWLPAGDDGEATQPGEATLRVADDRIADGAAGNGDGAGHGPAPAGAPPVRLLLAEDAPLQRRFAARLLEERGWTVHAVGSIDELLEAARSGAADVAVVDWHLGDRESGEALDRLRSRGLPVVVLSGDPQAVTTDGVPVLGKPVDWDELEVHLHRLAYRPAGPAPGGRLPSPGSPADTSSDPDPS